jgi:hypothetical protein
VVISIIINKKLKNCLRKGLTNLSGSGISPKGNSPKLLRIGALENCKFCSLACTLKFEFNGCPNERRYYLPVISVLPSLSQGILISVLIGETSDNTEGDVLYTMMSNFGWSLSTYLAWFDTFRKAF